MTEREKVIAIFDCILNRTEESCSDADCSVDNECYGGCSKYVVMPYEACAHAFALLKKQEARWIPVTERLPEPVCAQTRRKTKPVLLYSPKGGVYVGWYFGKDYRGHHLFKNRTSKDSLQYITTKVTHWMPLTELPKEEDTE